jgi:hypothetical protein
MIWVGLVCHDKDGGRLTGCQRQFDEMELAGVGRGSDCWGSSAANPGILALWWMRCGCAVAGNVLSRSWISKALGSSKGTSATRERATKWERSRKRGKGAEPG